MRTNSLPSAIYGAAELQLQLGLLSRKSFAEAREQALSVLAGRSRSNGDEAMSGALTTLAVLDWNERGRARATPRGQATRAGPGTRSAPPAAPPPHYPAPPTPRPTAW